MRTLSQQGLRAAARTAQLKPAQIPAALDAFAALTPQDLDGMSAWAADPVNDWADLAMWKATWAAQLGPLDDATAAFVVALIVRRAGGTVV